MYLLLFQTKKCFKMLHAMKTSYPLSRIRNISPHRSLPVFNGRHRAELSNPFDFLNNYKTWSESFELLQQWVLENSSPAQEGILWVCVYQMQFKSVRVRGRHRFLVFMGKARRGLFPGLPQCSFIPLKLDCIFFCWVLVMLLNILCLNCCFQMFTLACKFDSTDIFHTWQRHWPALPLVTRLYFSHPYQR